MSAEPYRGEARWPKRLAGGVDRGPARRSRMPTRSRNRSLDRQGMVAWSSRTGAWELGVMARGLKWIRTAALPPAGRLAGAEPTNCRAFRNSRIQPLYSPAPSGRQEFCTERVDRSGCGIMIGHAPIRIGDRRLVPYGEPPGSRGYVRREPCDPDSHSGTPTRPLFAQAAAACAATRTPLALRHEQWR